MSSNLDGCDEGTIRCPHCPHGYKCPVCKGSGLITIDQHGEALDRADDDVKEASISSHFDD